MSALEQIRKRPALVISILGVALVLFLFTGFDSIRQLLFGRSDTIAKVEGEKISAMEYSNRIQELRQQNGNNNDFDYDGLALNELITETLLNEEMDKVGIEVTDEELQNYLFGQSGLYLFLSYAQSHDIRGFSSPEDFYNFAYSDDPNAAKAKAIWEKYESDVTKYLMQRKYMFTLLSSLPANKIDAQYAYNDIVPYSLSVVSKPISGVPNSDVTVTNDEINAQYNKEKSRYAIPSEMRRVAIINVEATPSTEDYQKAQDEVLALVDQLRNTNDVEFANGDYNYSTKVVSGSANTIDANAGTRNNVIKNNIASFTEENSSRLLQSGFGQDFVVGKLMGTSSGLESANLDVYVTELPADSALNLLATLPADSIKDLTEVFKASNLQLTASDLGNPKNAAQNQKPTFGKKDVTTIREAIEALPADSSYVALADPKAFIAAITGQPVSNVGDGFNVIARVNSRGEMVPIYDMTVITREVKASDKTVSDTYNKLQQFISDNSSASKFEENAAANGYNVTRQLLDATDMKIGNSTAAAKWVWLTASEGDISQIFSENNDSKLMVVALSGVYEDYIPVSDYDVKNDITNRLRNQKKAAQIAAGLNNLTDRSLQGYAEALGTTIAENQPLTMVDTRDPALAAAFERAKKQPGTVVGPVVGQDGVYVFVLNNVMPTREYDYKTEVASFNNDSPFGSNVLSGNFLNGTRVIPQSNKNIGGGLRHDKEIELEDIRFHNAE